MSLPDIKHSISRELLNFPYYFQSLIEQAQFYGLLSDIKLSEIQTDLLMILAEQADLLDIVSDAELYEKDLELLINMLPMSAFVALLARYPDDDFLDRESDRLLSDALQKRKQRLSSDKKLQIERALDVIQKEEI